MVSLSQFLCGLRQYLDSELVSKVTGINKWIVGAGLSMAIDNGADVFNKLKENKMIKSMNVINSEDEIDLQKLYKYFSEQAKKNAVTFNLDYVGAITLKQTDIEKLYQFIMESK